MLQPEYEGTNRLFPIHYPEDKIRIYTWFTLQKILLDLVLLQFKCSVAELVNFIQLFLISRKYISHIAFDSSEILSSPWFLHIVCIYVLFSWPHLNIHVLTQWCKLLCFGGSFIYGSLAWFDSIIFLRAETHVYVLWKKNTWFWKCSKEEFVTCSG